MIPELIPQDGRMQVLRYAAFTDDPDAGNPAGVVLDADGATADEMLATAVAVGYSETAFVTSDEPRLAGRVGSAPAVRYFSPRAEVPFCGHATIATAVALAERSGPDEFRLRTPAGEVPVTVRQQDGRLAATLTSVPPQTVALTDDDLAELLAALRWSADELDPGLPVRVGYAGAWHPVLAAGTRARLADLDYDFARLAALMSRRDWTTIQLVWRETPTLFHARNPFPPGGVVEDPVTGAAAAAFGGYLRELSPIATPAELTIVQGEDLGRPGTIRVGVPSDPASGIEVSGTAVRMPDPPEGWAR